MKYSELFKEVMDIRRGVHPEYDRRGDAIYNVESFLSSLARDNSALAADFVIDLTKNADEYILENNAAPISVARAVSAIKNTLNLSELESDHLSNKRAKSKT
jgi:hypothetical protein